MPDVHWLDLPEGLAKVLPPVPPLDVSFLGRDVSEALRKRIEDRKKIALEEAVACYDWTIEQKPELVVTWNDSLPPQRAMVMAGKDLGVPTVEIEHGQMHQYLHHHFETKRFADWIFATYEYRAFHEFYKMQGTVVPTGSPKFDMIAEIDGELLRQEARKELRFKDHHYVVTYLGNWMTRRSAWHDNGLAVNAFLEFAHAYQQIKAMVPELQLVFKKHPSDLYRIEEWRADLKDMGIFKDLTLVDEELEIALGAADLVVGPRSSAMVEAMILGIPCLAFEYLPMVDEWQFENRGIKMLRDPAKIMHAMFDLLMDEDKRIEVLQGIPEGLRYFGCVGGAGARVVRGLQLLLAGKEPDEGCWA